MKNAEQIRQLVNQILDLLPEPKTVPATPSKVVAPTAPASPVPAQISLLIAKAVNEVSKLTGPRVGELVARILDIQKSQTLSEAHENAKLAISFSQFLRDDLQVDVGDLTLTPLLNQIRDLSGEDANVLISDTDENQLDVTG